MTSDPHSEDGGSDRLRNEAARWFAAMRGPRANALRTAFERWFAADERHRIAYNQAAEIFALGGILSSPSQVGARRSQGRLRLLRVLAIAAMLAVFATGVTAMLSRYWLPEVGRRRLVSVAPADIRSLTTRPDRQKTLGLADGSTLVVDRSTRVTITFTDTQRILRLARGRARLNVARDTRPFVVVSSAGSVMALGTVFDVAVERNGATIVHLLRGAVAVEGAGRRVRLSAGQAMTLAPGGRPVRVVQLEGRASDWISERMDCDRVPLGALLSEAANHSRKSIRLASADLAKIRVSGTYGVADADQLGSDLALVLGLTLIRGEGGELTLAGPAARN